MSLQLSSRSRPNRSRSLPPRWLVSDPCPPDPDDGAKLVKDPLIQRRDGSDEIPKNVNAERHLCQIAVQSFKCKMS